MAYSKEEKKAKFQETLKHVRNGLSVVKACKEPDTLGETLFYDFVALSDKNTKDYARAMSKRADFIFEDILTIADKQDKDVYIDSEGNEKTDHNIVQRSRLQVDARKWVLARMNPKKYGDKVEQTIKTDNSPFTPIDLNVPRDNSTNED